MSSRCSARPARASVSMAERSYYEYHSTELYPYWHFFKVSKTRYRIINSMQYPPTLPSTRPLPGPAGFDPPCTKFPAFQPLSIAKWSFLVARRADPPLLNETAGRSGNYSELPCFRYCDRSCDDWVMSMMEGYNSGYSGYTAYQPYTSYPAYNPAQPAHFNLKVGILMKVPIYNV